MRVTTKGQVTIPAEIRQEFGFLPDTEVEFIVMDGAVHLRLAEHPRMRRGERVAARLRGRAGRSMTTDEILALTRRP